MHVYMSQNLEIVDHHQATGHLMKISFKGIFLKKIIDINMYVHMYIFSPHPCKSFKKVGVFL